MHLTTRRLAPVALVVILTFAAAACAPPPAANGGGVTGDAMAAVNQDRAAQGLAPLAWDTQLGDYAQSWANRIASSGNLVHTDLEGLLRLPYMSAWRSMRENLLMASAGTSGAAAEDLWMASAGHRENILATNVNQIGVGAVYSGGRLWLVAEFGAR
jgi:uncharacterized protein YkwD